MEVLAVLIPMLAFMLPIIVMFVIYAAVLALAIWFVISLLNNQKERNRLLAEISMNIKDKKTDESNQQTGEAANTYTASSLPDSDTPNESVHEE